MTSVTRRSDGAGRIDVGPAGHVLLQDVVLHRPRERVLGDPAPARRRDVQREQDGRGGVDGHRGGDALERDAVEQRLHVLEAVDGHAHAADLARGMRVVGVVADLRGQVEGDGQPGGAALEQVAVAAVRLRGGAEARVLPHGPELRAVAGGVQAARERVAAGRADGVRVPHVLRPVHRVARQVGRGLERRPALRRLTPAHGQGSERADGPPTIASSGRSRSASRQKRAASARAPAAASRSPARSATSARARCDPP